MSHTIYNQAGNFAGYEGYTMPDPGSTTRHAIGLNMVYQRLTTSYDKYLFHGGTSNNIAHIATDRNASPVDGSHNTGSVNFDLVILNLTLTNISDFDEQVEIDAVWEKQAASQESISTTINGPSLAGGTDKSVMPTSFWIPKGTSFVLYNKMSPLYVTREKVGFARYMRFKTMNNANSVDLVCSYAIVDQENEG
jgi:hypothetical protein